MISVTPLSVNRSGNWVIKGDLLAWRLLTGLGQRNIIKVSWAQPDALRLLCGAERTLKTLLETKLFIAKTDGGWITWLVRHTPKQCASLGKTNHRFMLVLVFAILAQIALGQIFPGHGLNSSTFRQYRELCCIGGWRQTQQVTLLTGVDSCPGFTARDVLEMSGATDSNGAQPFPFLPGWLDTKSALLWKVCSTACLGPLAYFAFLTHVFFLGRGRFFTLLDAWHPGENHHTLTPWPNTTCQQLLDFIWPSTWRCTLKISSPSHTKLLMF